MKLADLRARIQETVEAHTKQLSVIFLLLKHALRGTVELTLLVGRSGAINKQQANRLEQAIEARENIDQLIREKLAELQKKGKTLAAVLEKGYEYRLEKARSLSTQASEQEQPKDQDQDQARRGKRVKVDLSST